VSGFTTWPVSAQVEGLSLIWYFGHLCEVRICRSILELSDFCLAGCGTVSSVIFESGSTLSCIEGYVFANCSSFSSINIRSSVETIYRYCFAGCKSLWTITFESGSKLSCIEGYGFRHCSSLSSSYIPSSRQHILHEHQRYLKTR
jgi:hypothetical protein